MALSEVSRLLQSYGIDGVFKNGAMLKTLHRQVQEDFGEEASTDIEIKSQKEDRVAAAYLPVGRFASVLKTGEQIIPLRQVLV